MGSQQSLMQQPTSSSMDTNLDETKFILDHVENNCVLVFSKSYCIYCKNTKKLFKELEIPYKAIELNQMKSGQKIQDALGQMTNGTTVTVPRVFVNGECIGGASDTKALHQTGQLLKLIQRCKR